jgi:hypothetical protein
MHNEVNRLLAYITKRFTQNARGKPKESDDLELSKMHMLYSVERYCEWEW